MTAKKFRNIKKLAIDGEVHEAMRLELGDEAEVAVFNLWPKLTKLVFLHIMDKNTGLPLEITRANVKSAQNTAEMAKRNKEAELKRQIDVYSASVNPRSEKMNPVQKYRLHQKSAGLTSGAWESCKKNFRDDKWIKGSIAGIFTIATLPISAGLLGISKLGGKR